MKKFAHFNTQTVAEAVSLLADYGKGASIIAGGTDILGKLKDNILPKYPEALINILTIPGLDQITESGGNLQVGATALLEDIATNALIKKKFTALAQATEKTASPHIREMGTLAGNVCQDIRCWYYRNPDNRFPCLRKGGGRCYAIEGDNRYHSIFGGTVEKGCYAVHPSDTAPAVIALDGEVVTSKRKIKADDFFKAGVRKTTVLDDGEIVTGFEFPEPAADTCSAFIKFAIRKSIDFPIVNCAAAVTRDAGVVKKVRICLNAVYIKPYRAEQAEAAVMGKALTEENADAAGQALADDAKPMKDNAYMVQIARTLVKRTLLACGADA
jgi:xanthine dehydrogenase YagS FAD-binding subunit